MYEVWLSNDAKKVYSVLRWCADQHESFVAVITDRKLIELVANYEKGFDQTRLTLAREELIEKMFIKLDNSHYSTRQQHPMYSNSYVLMCKNMIFFLNNFFYHGLYDMQFNEIKRSSARAGQIYFQVLVKTLMVDKNQYKVDLVCELTLKKNPYEPSLAAVYDFILEPEIFAMFDICEPNTNLTTALEKINQYEHTVFYLMLKTMGFVYQQSQGNEEEDSNAK